MGKSEIEAYKARGGAGVERKKEETQRRMRAVMERTGPTPTSPGAELLSYLLMLMLLLMLIQH